MERAEEVTALSEEKDSVDIDRRPTVGSFLTTGRLILLALMVNAALVAGILYLASAMSMRLDAAREELRSQTESTKNLAKETGVLAAHNEKLESELTELRQFIASRSVEDVIFLKIVITKPEIDRKLARTIARHIHKYAELHGQDPDLVLAMMAVESDFNPRAVSNVGATGLMQIMPQWKKVLGIQEELTDVETSVRYGLQILGFYRNMYKDMEMALTAYNRGPGPVDHALMKGKDPTNKYAPRVLRTYKQLKSLNTGRT